MSDIERNMAYDFLANAERFNSVIRIMKQEKVDFEDKVAYMVHSIMIKKLEQKRDSYMAQGLNGLQSLFVSVGGPEGTQSARKIDESIAGTKSE